jgi:hypothetical protein
MRYIFYIIVSVILFSCSASRNLENGNNTNIQIDSYGQESIGDKKYILFPYDSVINSNYLLYTELSGYVDKTLSIKGYTKVGTIDSASYIIFLKYGTSDPKNFEQEIYIPIYGQTGIASSNTRATASKI